MNLRDFEYLVAVADHLHFGRAARACYVSQPTLSTQLKKLEHELGTELVERGARQIRLTPAGEEVVARARRVLADVADIRTVATRAGNPRAGTMRLGIFPTLGPYLLPHVISHVRDAFPDLELLLVEEQSDTLLSQVREGQLDAAVLASPIHDDSLTQIPLFTEDFVAFLPVGHPLAENVDEPLPITALDGHRILLLTEGHCLRDQALAVCHQATAKGEEAAVGFAATSLETLRHMVCAGVGVTLLPRLAVSSPVAPPTAAIIREFSAPVPHRDLVVLSRTSSVHAALLPELALTLRQVPTGLVRRQATLPVGSAATAVT